MNKEQLQERLENLKLQQKQAEVGWSKIQGAIEFCESLLKEQSSNNNDNGTVKHKKRDKAVA